jgi:hypothetical protein
MSNNCQHPGAATHCSTVLTMFLDGSLPKGACRVLMVAAAAPYMAYVGLRQSGLLDCCVWPASKISPPL